MNGAGSSDGNPSGVQGVCPSGWHLPSDSEWIELTNYLGGSNIAGGKLKETGTTHWNSPNTGATNESGFTALPGGLRYGSGTFTDVGFGTDFWTASDIEGTNAWIRNILYDRAVVNRVGNYMGSGVSVRCVRDD